MHKFTEVYLDGLRLSDFMVTQGTSVYNFSTEVTAREWNVAAAIVGFDQIPQKHFHIEPSPVTC